MLEVTTNFVWAYALQLPGADASVAVLHDTVVWHLPHPADVRPTSRGLWLAHMKSYGWNLDCVAIRQGLLDVGRPDYAAPPLTEDPDRLYDPNHPIAVDNAC